MAFLAYTENGARRTVWLAPGVNAATEAERLGVTTYTTHADASTLPAQTPTPLDVIEERNRRIIAGTTINVTGHGDVQLAGDAQTRSDLQALVTIAQMRLAASDTTTLRVRGKDGTIHTLTPAQVVELWAKGVAFIQSVIDVSWTIEAMDPIPSDYATRSEWP